MPASTVHSLGTNKVALAQISESRFNGSVINQLENDWYFCIWDVCHASFKVKEWRYILQNPRS